MSAECLLEGEPTSYIRHEVVGCAGSIINVRRRVYEDVARRGGLANVHKELGVPKICARGFVGRVHDSETIFRIAVDVGLHESAAVEVHASRVSGEKRETWTARFMLRLLLEGC